MRAPAARSGGAAGASHDSARAPALSLLTSSVGCINTPDGQPPLPLARCSHNALATNASNNAFVLPCSCKSRLHVDSEQDVITEASPLPITLHGLCLNLFSSHR